MILLSGNKKTIDRISGLIAAYNFNRVVGTYTGAAVRVRRSSDNAESDIGFIGYNFDLTAFNAFIGAGSGYCKTFYDQSGNNRHVTQSDNLKQPEIKTDDDIYLNHTGTQYLEGAHAVYSVNFTIHAKISMSVQAIYGIVGFSGTSTQRNDFYLRTNELVVIQGSTGNFYKNGVMNFPINFSNFFAMSTPKIYYETSDLPLTWFSSGAAGANSDIIRIGGTTLTMILSFQGKMKAATIYNRALTTAEIAALNNIF